MHVHIHAYMCILYINYMYHSGAAEKDTARQCNTSCPKQSFFQWKIDFLTCMYMYMIHVHVHTCMCTKKTQGNRFQKAVLPTHNAPVLDICSSSWAMEEPQLVHFNRPSCVVKNVFSPSGDVVLIDMEFSGVNYPAFDIGCFFCEFAGKLMSLHTVIL